MATVYFCCFVAICSSLMTQCFGATIATKEVLDATNLNTLNRELRKALLEKVQGKLTQSQRRMNSMQPQLLDCQNKVNKSLGACAICVDNQCQRQYQNCGTLTIHSHTPGGASISTSTVNGRSKMTICSFMGSLSRTCETILNPAGFFTSAITQINGDLTVHLQKMTGDLGGVVVGNFINGLSGVVSGVNSNTNITTMTPEEQKAFQQSMNQMQTTLQNSMQNLHASLSNIGPQIQHSMNHMADGLHQMGQNMGQSMSQWGHQFATQLSNSLSNMFNGLFGRRRRAVANQHCDVQLADFTAACGKLTTQCSSCQNIDRNAIMMRECGADLVHKVEAIEKSMKQLNQIFTEISSAQNILTKVEFDSTLVDPANIGYGGVVLYANIRGQPASFQFTQNLELRNLAGTATNMAQKVWKEWAKKMTTP